MMTCGWPMMAIWVLAIGVLLLAGVALVKDIFLDRRNGTVGQ